MSTPDFEFSATEEVWPLERPFRISRGVRSEARVIMVTVTDGQNTGRGEAVPSRRYKQSSASVIAQLQEVFPKLTSTADRQQVQELLPPGAARNALDCALWDFDAKRRNKRVWEIAGLSVTDQVVTAFTISLDSPDEMAAVARRHVDAPLLKLKLNGDNLDLARVEAVRKEAARARLVVDANEAWSPEHYRETAPALSQLGVELIEQPFPADADQVLESLDHPVAVCADESCHTTSDLPRLADRYQAINIKLDKTGGLTGAIRLNQAARDRGFKILFGCMVCTSLGIAPSRLLTRTTDYVDLDGPLLLLGDREHGLSYDHGKVGLPSPELWG